MLTAKIKICKVVEKNMYKNTCKMHTRNNGLEGCDAPIDCGYTNHALGTKHYNDQNGIPSSIRAIRECDVSNSEIVMKITE